MVIKDILSKVNKTDPDDPKVQELREKLSKLKEKQQPTPQQSNTQTSTDQKQPADTPDKQKKESPQKKQPAAKKPSKDDLEELAKASEEERKRFAQEQDPQLRVKEERTHKLVAKQVSELIELTTKLQKRLTKSEQQNKNLHQEIERLEKKNEDVREKMDLIDGRLEKFMGLYEIITNQYNPFAEEESVSEAAPNTPSNVPASKQALRVADDLHGDESVVEYEQGEMSSENKAKINKLLADLEVQERKKRDLDSEEEQAVEVREEEVADSLREELHEMFSGFEQRMQQYLDSSLQEKLHTTISDLESVLNQEIKEAVEDHVDSLSSHDDVIESAFKELEALESSASDVDNYKEEEQAFVEEVSSVDEQIKAVPPSLYFRLRDGRVLKSKKDLVDALADMDDSVFSHHVNKSHNDFADWLELALNDPLGAELRGLSREEMLAVFAQE